MNLQRPELGRVPAGNPAEPEIPGRGDQSGGLKVAAIPAVRAAPRLAAAFRKPSRRRGSGSRQLTRDIGTVVCPDAKVKIFITASVEARAERRSEELQARESVIYARVLEDMRGGTPGIRRDLPLP